jgi:hypothetical protein
MVTVGNTSYTEFKTAWVLKGEEMEVFTFEGSQKVDWLPVATSALNGGLVWLQGSFFVTEDLLPFVGQAQPNQTALVVNLSGLNKGVVYVNGFDLGRYWLIEGECDDQACAPPRLLDEHCYVYWKDCGQPTQSRYHIPFEVLRQTENILTVFEETIPEKPRVLGRVFLEVLHEHIV